MPQTRTDRWAPAVAHLIATDVRWRAVIERVGPCRLRPHKDRFGLLVRSIISQQISKQAAISIDARLRGLTGRPHEPVVLLNLREARLRRAGLSSAKAEYVRNLAKAVHSGRLPLRQIGRWDDEAIIERMTEVKGIGRWTAEMF